MTSKGFSSDVIKKRFGGSLTRRILLVGFIFLIVPFLLYSFIMYRQDYRVKTRDIYHSMYFLQKGQAEILQQHIYYGLDLVELLSSLIKDINAPPGFYEGTMAALSDHFINSKSFYLKKDNVGSWICSRASDENMIGKNFSTYVDLKNFKKHFRLNNSFILLKDKTDFLPKSLLLGHAHVDAKGNIEDLLLLSIPINSILQKISILQLSKTSSSVSIFSKEGVVFASTKSDLEGKKFVTKMQGKQEILLKRENLTQRGFHYSFEDENFLALKTDLKDLDFDLLLSVPSFIPYDAFKHYLSRLVFLLFFILFIGGFGTFFLSKRLSKPLMLLSSTMRSVGEGDLNARYPGDRFGFEINEVGLLFNQMVDSLINYIDKAKSEEAKKEALKQELLIGHEVQGAILPKIMPEFPKVEIAAGYASAKEVGGDYYDVLVKDFPEEGKFLFTIADTSGKGVFGCLYSLNMRSILRSYGSVLEDLGEIVRHANNLFCQDTGDTGAFVTAWIGLFDQKTNILNYSSCGHPPTILKRVDGKIEKLTTPGIAFGVTPLEKISTSQIELQSGDLLVLYTDGVTEALNPQMKMFKEERLIDLVSSMAVDHANKMVEAIMEDVALFTEGAAQFDDITLLVLRVK